MKRPHLKRAAGWSALALVIAAACIVPSLATRGEGDKYGGDGFVSLFNGKDLSGWKIPAGDGGHWKVVDGVIDYDAQSQATGSKDLWTEKSYGDYVLRVDWRIKETPYTNPNVPYILPDGTHARDTRGKEMKMSLPDSDSGIILRGDVRNQINIWCWPIGSGEIYGIRTNPKSPPEVRAAATPRTQADKPIGQWNRFEITARGKTLKVVLNGKTVLPEAEYPDLPTRGVNGRGDPSGPSLVLGANDLPIIGYLEAQNLGSGSSWQSLNITTGFVSGANTLDFYVSNTGGTPSGLQIQMTALP